VAAHTSSADVGNQFARVFAVGDTRSGDVKRVASAVGEGAISVHMVHQALVELQKNARERWQQSQQSRKSDNRNPSAPKAGKVVSGRKAAST
jgi:hypothetical protein